MFHHGHLYLEITGSQALIRTCLRTSGQLPAPQVALIALILGRDQKPVPILMTHIHNHFTGPGRGVNRPLPARCHVQENNLHMVGPGKAQGQDIVDVNVMISIVCNSKAT